MKHENTKVSERSQSYKATLYMMPFMPNAQNSEIHEDGKKIGGYQGESIETESRLMAARGCGGAGMTADGHRVSFYGDESALELDRGAGCLTL